jgi:hypothetical protein
MQKIKKKNKRKLEIFVRDNEQRKCWGKINCPFFYCFKEKDA